VENNKKKVGAMKYYDDPVKYKRYLRRNNKAAAVIKPKRTEWLGYAVLILSLFTLYLELNK